MRVVTEDQHNKRNMKNVTVTIWKVLLLIILSMSTFLFTSCGQEVIEHGTPEGDHVYVPDFYFEELLVEKGYDTDGIVNHEISKVDALKVTRLEINNSDPDKQILDLRGIEGFTNLTYLSATRHAIVFIDLQHNAKLDTVLLQGNAIYSLDVSKNPALELLDLSANELLDIKGLMQLKVLRHLDLSFNSLQRLDIKNLLVERVLVNNNKLKSIQINEASALLSLILTSNQLLELNVAEAPKLNTLLISDNQIETITLEKNTALEYLWMSSNQLAELNVSENRALVDLRVDKNSSLTCIQIAEGQEIPTVSLSNYQQLNTECN